MEGKPKYGIKCVHCGKIMEPGDEFVEFEGESFCEENCVGEAVCDNPSNYLALESGVVEEDECDELCEYCGEEPMLESSNFCEKCDGMARKEFEKQEAEDKKALEGDNDE